MCDNAFSADTSKTFLDDLEKQSVLAWESFERIYAPFILHHVRQCGVQESYASDVKQDVLVAVATNICGFQHEGQKASFRSWLKQISRNKAIDFIRRLSKREGGANTEDILTLAAQASDPDETDANHQQIEQLYERAMNELLLYFRSSSIEIFIALARGASVAEVATEFQKSSAAIRQTKVRVLHKLRELAGE